MKTFNFTVRTSKETRAVLGRGMANIPALFPGLFRSADKICLVTGTDAPHNLRARALELFPESRWHYFYFRLPPSETAKTLEQAGKLCAFLFDKSASFLKEKRPGLGRSWPKTGGTIWAFYLRPYSLDPTLF